MVPDEDALVDLYRQFRQECLAQTFDGHYVPYDWCVMPATLPVAWLPYREMLREYAAELANTVNALTTTVHRLKAWGALLSRLSPQQQLDAKIEFIDALGTGALGMPYAIKSRFTYVVAHLSHQANGAKDSDRPDVFPEEETLYLNHLDPICSGWRRFRRFKVGLERVGGSAFRERSGDFRHSYNHRVPPQIALGMTGLVTRTAPKNGPVSYSFGGRAPLDVASLATLLASERDLCVAAFGLFQALVEEQIAAVVGSL